MTTKDSRKLSGITTEELRERLAEKPSEGQAVMRLVAAREYKAGLSPGEIEAKYGWPEGTVYHWLDYFDERGVDGALTDKRRSGRPPKLDDADRQQFIDDLQRSPGAFGYERQSWVPALAQQHLETEYGVEYSLRHVTRLMNESGLSWESTGSRHRRPSGNEDADENGERG